jgi:hypothetical protein
MSVDAREKPISFQIHTSEQKPDNSPPPLIETSQGQSGLPHNQHLPKGQTTTGQRHRFPA